MSINTSFHCIELMAKTNTEKGLLVLGITSILATIISISNHKNKSTEEFSDTNKKLLPKE